LPVRRNLGADDLGDLLEQPLVAVLATYRRDGTVLLSPVWHEWQDGGFNVVTNGDGVKVRHLRRDPRAAIVVCESRPPYRGIEVQGEARLEAIGGAVRRIARRYLGERGAAAYVQSARDDTLIRLEPGRLRAWDFADEYGTTRG
jgi:PPOX class probable F420-dependent enzyme